MDSKYNIADQLQNEIYRCRDLLEEYTEIGPPGSFVHATIKQYIAESVQAYASDDVEAMVIAYEKLKGSTNVH